jgi:hypothetical protein
MSIWTWKVAVAVAACAAGVTATSPAAQLAATKLLKTIERLMEFPWGAAGLQGAPSIAALAARAFARGYAGPQGEYPSRDGHPLTMRVMHFPRNSRILHAPEHVREG